jgi:hypothetical protein
MSYYTYNGSNGPDEIDTQDIADSLSYYTDGIILNGNSGDDTLSATIVGEDRIDEITGGLGNDWMAATAIGTGFAAVLLDGGDGSDYAYLPFSIGSFTKEAAGIEFNGNSRDGSPISVLVGYTTEIIADITGAYYLVEDLYRDRVRAVSWDEAYARSYNGNQDWYFRNLDTYSAYHGAASTPTSSATSSSGGNVFQVPFGQGGRWLKKSKLRRSDTYWDVKGKGKNKMFLVDNDVAQIDGYNMTSDSLSTQGFDVNNTMLYGYRAALNPQGEWVYTNTLMTIGNNVIAHFRGLTPEQAGNGFYIG